MNPGTYLPSDNPRVKPSEVPFYHCVPFQLRFSDFDLMGHLNNNIYFACMDMGKVDYFNTLVPEKVNIRDYGIVVAHVSADFYAPTLPGESIEIWTTVTHIGDRSFTLEQRIVESHTGETKCIGRTVMAGFDVRNCCSAPIPSRWTDAIRAYEKREL